MENEKNDNIKKDEIPSKLKLPTDDSYYEGLYNDLPKEVVELLMKTHPLMDSGQGEKMAERFITKHTRQLEAAEIKAIRRSTVLNDETNLQKTQVMPLPSDLLNETLSKKLQRHIMDEEKDDIEDDLIKLVKHKSKGYGMQDTDEKRSAPVHTKALAKKKADPSSSQESAQLKTSVKPFSKRTPNLEENELSITTREEFKKKKPARKEGTDRRRTYKDYSNMNLNQMTTDQNLNEFFDSDIKDSDKKLILPGGRKTIVAVITAGVLVFSILAFRTVSLTGKLQKANAQLTDLSTAKEENNQLKLQMLTMEEEIKGYKSGNPPAENKDGSGDADPGSSETIDPNSFDTYTVVDGDIIWNISAKVYGNGAYYKRILEANQMTEDSVLKIGQQLKIPKIQ